MIEFVTGYLLGSSGNKNCDCNDDKEKYFDAEKSAKQIVFTFILFFIAFLLYYFCTNYFSNIILNFLGFTDFLKTLNGFNERNISTPPQLIFGWAWLHRDFFLFFNLIFSLFIFRRNKGSQE